MIESSWDAPQSGARLPADNSSSWLGESIVENRLLNISSVSKRESDSNELQVIEEFKRIDRGGYSRYERLKNNYLKFELFSVVGRSSSQSESQNKKFVKLFLKPSC